MGNAKQRMAGFIDRIRLKRLKKEKGVRERHLSGWHVKSVETIQPLMGPDGKPTKNLVARVNLNPKRIALGSKTKLTCILKPIGKGERDRESALNNAMRMRHLRSIGLPVPHAAAVEIEGIHYIATEAFVREIRINGRKEYVSKITPVNEIRGRPYPVFLKKLKIPEHADLIRTLGEDLATLYNHGYAPPTADFWGFYERADGRLDRIIHDVEFPHEPVTKGRIQLVFSGIRGSMKGKELELFMKSFNQHYKPKNKTAEEKTEDRFGRPFTLKR